MAQDIRSEPGQREQLSHARPGHTLSFSECLDIQLGLNDLILPAVRKTDRIHTMLLGFKLRRDDQVMAVGAEEQSATIELLDLELKL